MATLKSKQAHSRQKARRLIKSIDRYADLPSNQVVHHLDENPFNNDPYNLTIISNNEHMELHWLLNPDIMGRKPKSTEQLLKELEDLLIEYNINK